MSTACGRPHRADPHYSVHLRPPIRMIPLHVDVAWGAGKSCGNNTQS